MVFKNYFSNNQGKPLEIMPEFILNEVYFQQSEIYQHIRKLSAKSMEDKQFLIRLPTLELPETSSLRFCNFAENTIQNRGIVPSHETDAGSQ